MNHRIFILTAALLLLIGKARGQYCTNNSRYTDVQFFDSTEITIGTNIQYGVAQDFQGNPYPLRMDLYYPNLTIDLSPKRPFIMLFHGGGFSSGDKQSGDIRDLCVHLALRGFVCASVNYRLGHDFSEYGQYKARYRAIQDGNAALRYIVNNANIVRVDTSWLFVGGQSAGSLLALGMVYADQPELDSISLLYNATAISAELGGLHNSGNNLTRTFSVKGVFNNWGGAVKSEVDVDEMIPTIAFHGELDTVVRIDSDNSFLHYTLNGSRALFNDLTANNVCSEITIDTSGEHGIFRNASSVFRVKRASCFFKNVFCSSCTSFYTTDSIPSNCSTPLVVDENKFGQDIKISPNPFEDSFSVDGIDGVFDLSIYNGLGQRVFRDEMLNGIIQVDLVPGIYFLNLHEVESGRSFTTKLIKN
jgi:acetyl esterase/lipase